MSFEDVINSGIFTIKRAPTKRTHFTIEYENDNGDTQTINAVVGQGIKNKFLWIEVNKIKYTKLNDIYINNIGQHIPKEIAEKLEEDSNPTAVNHYVS